MKKESGSIPSLSSSLVRNTAYNLFSQGIFVVLALWAIPILIRKLGEEQFGLFSLVWALIGYFSLLDFGISRANTKFLSEAVANDDRAEIPKVVWTSLISTLLLSIVTSTFIIAATPYAVDTIFKIDSVLRNDAIRFFTIAGIGIPFLIIFGTLKGFQMALQRFDLVNLYQALTGIVQWFGSVLLLEWHYGLESIIILAVGVRVVFAIVAFVTLPVIIPGIFREYMFIDRSTLKKLWSFGGWVTISQIISPLFLYLDRFFIGIFLTLSAVAYYSVPQEALTRVLVLSISFTATLFPVMSGHSTKAGNESTLILLYERSVKYLTVIMIPLILGFILFAQEIVQLWLGADFARNSVVVFQILAVGLLFNSLAQIPTTVLHAYGRPDLTAKLHFIELLVVVVLNVILIPLFGIAGAATAWSVRVFIDAALLFYTTQRYTIKISIRKSLGLAKGKVPLLPFLSMLLITIVYFGNSAGKIISTVVFFMIYCGVTWFHSFDSSDRVFFMQLRRKIFG